MSNAVAMLGFMTTPMTLSGLQHLLFLGPLCLAIGIVYKTIRCEDLREVPLAALAQCVTVIAGMFGVGVGVWLLFLALS
jgi:hypothetical protein